MYRAEFTGPCRLTIQFLLFSVLVVTIVMYLIKLPFKMMNTLTRMPFLCYLFYRLLIQWSRYMSVIPSVCPDSHDPGPYFARGPQGTVSQPDLTNFSYTEEG